MKILKPNNVYASPRYAPGILAGNTIYTAGRIPIDADGNIVAPHDARAQTEQILDCIEAILAEGGAGLKNVVNIHTYYLVEEDMPAIFEVLHARIGPYLPPHTGSHQSSSSWEERGIRLELEITAVIEDRNE